MNGKNEKKGIALLLVTGLIALLGALAAAFMMGLRPAGNPAGQSRSASLAAGSGLQYAGARLREGASYSLYPRTVANRADDWASRDDLPVPLVRALNPSYSHGESWTDSGFPTDAPGAYDPGTDNILSSVDLDGDGKFSAWSGRLRGRGGPFSERFLLFIDSVGSRIPVNRETRHGQQLDQVALSRLLDNLGAIVLPAGHPRRRTLATSGVPIETSFLGSDILDNAPSRGYQDATDLAGVLTSIGGGSAYPPGPGGAPRGLAEILPYVTFASPMELSPTFHYPASNAVPIPIELASVSGTVLSAIWRYASHASMTARWGPSAPGQTDPRTGLPFSNSRIILYPEEADRIADKVVEYRQGALAVGNAPVLSGLYERLLLDAPTLFPNGPPLDNFPVEVARYAQSKADLAFFAVSPDSHPHPTTPPVGWASWGMERLREAGSPTTVRRLPEIACFGTGYVRTPATGNYTDPTDPFLLQADAAGSPGAILTARPPTGFLVTAEGISGSSPAGPEARRQGDGTIDTAIPFFLGTQQDFEGEYPPVPGEPFEAIGITLRADRAWSGEFADDLGRREIVGDGDDRFRRVVSLPGWARQGYPGWGAGFSAYSGFFGALALAGRPPGLGNADLYFPFTEGCGTEGCGFETPSNFPCIVRTDLGIPSFTWMGLLPSGVGQSARSPLNPRAGRRDFPLQSLFTPWQVTGNYVYDPDDQSPGAGSDLSPAHAIYPPGARIPALMFLPPPPPPPGSPPRPPPPPPSIPYFAFEGWITHGVFGPTRASVIRFEDVGAHANFLTVTVESPGSGRIKYVLDGSWAGMNGARTSIGQVEVEIMETDPGASDFHFLQAAIAFDHGQARLTVNNRTEWGTFSNRYLPHAVPQVRLKVEGIDDLRLYGTAPQPPPFPPLPEDDATLLDGRFVRRGRYASPTYVLDQPRRLGCVHWEGIIPRWGGFPPDAIRVELKARGPGGAALPTVPLGSPGTSIDLARLGPVTEFSYTVEFDVTHVSVPLMDTPVFESIEFAIRDPKTRWIAYREE